MSIPTFQPLRINFGDLADTPINFLVNAPESKARIVEPLSGRTSKALATSNTSYAEIPFDATGATNLRIRFQAQISNEKTYIFFRGPGVLGWVGVKLPITQGFQNFSLGIPPPYVLSDKLSQDLTENRRKLWLGTTTMRVRFVTVGDDAVSYFEDVEIFESDEDPGNLFLDVLAAIAKLFL